MKALRRFLKKITSKEMLLYMLFGVGTFCIDTGMFITLSFFLELDKSTLLLHVCSVFSTMLAILFAYFTNRRFVFKSNKAEREILKEFFEFLSARICTLIISEIFLEITVIHLRLEERLMKLAINIVVIALNYVLSKFWIFKKNTY